MVLFIVLEEIQCIETKGGFKTLLPSYTEGIGFLHREFQGIISW